MFWSVIASCVAHVGVTAYRNYTSYFLFAYSLYFALSVAALVNCICGGFLVFKKCNLNESEY